MEPVESGGPAKRRRRCCIIVIVVVVLILICILALGLGLSQREENSGNEFKSTFLSRCQHFQGIDCQHTWEVFQKAYVNQNPCEVPVEAYDPFINAVAFKPPCNRMMFWSKTKDAVHDFTEKKDCFKTLEDTILGFILDDLTWCGEKGSFETFTTGCPSWTKCENSPVKSFWKRASIAFADAACGNVTAMLNGSINAPFNSSSIFASEVNKLKPTQVNSLTVVLVTQKNLVTNCTNQSFQDLKTKLNVGIKYICKEVPETQIQECGSNKEKACGACW